MPPRDAGAYIEHRTPDAWMVGTAAAVEPFHEGDIVLESNRHSASHGTQLYADGKSEKKRNLLGVHSLVTHEDSAFATFNQRNERRRLCNLGCFVNDHNTEVRRLPQKA